MPTQIVTAGDNVLHSLMQGFTAFMIFLPTLIGALIVLLVGWWISGVIGRLLERALYKAGFERTATHVGASEAISRIGAGWTASHIFGVLAKWFVRLIFLQAAANLLAMPQVTAIVNEIILFIPRLAIGMGIILVGLWAAKGLSELVHGQVTAAGIARPSVFSLLTRYAILSIAVIAAASEMGIAPVIVNAIFIAFVSALALAVGLAFGLGAKDVAAEMTRNWYNSGKSVAEKQKPQVVPGPARRDTR